MMRPIFVVLLCFVSAQSAVAQAAVGGTPGAPEIVNVGVGEVRLHPDRGSITVGVVTRAPTAAAAGRANVERLRPVLAALRRQALPDSAITTSGYSVELEYREPSAARSESRKYVARNAIRVVITRLDDLGRMIDTALASGATEITEIAFESSLAQVSRQRAIGMAVRAARSDAAAAAEAAGGTLGPIIEVEIDPNERSGGYGRRVMRLSEVVVTHTQVMPDDISIVVQARVRSALLRSAP